MTIQTLLDKVNDEKPNSFGTARLISFINEVEIEVAEQLGVDFDEDYTTDDLDTELLAKRPYDYLYVSYVKAQIDYANEEYGSYQNNQAQHVSDFSEFVDWVVRTGQMVNDPMPARFSGIF